jgi:16S rRNA (adenine1518-N6/adenine1519-N6)-dimethyltransferase
MNLTDVSTIRSLFKKHNFNLSKSFGQNFLIDEQIPKDIVKGAGINNQTGIIEIGPGIGVLTRELCKAAKKVVAVEIDNGLMPILKETLADFLNVSVIFGDVLKIDLKKLIEDEFKTMDVCVCANLPYYITTPIIMALLEQKLPLKSITVMVQKEVALRLCADETSKDYGAISLTVRYFCNPRLLFYVSSQQFLPAPKVDSAVIRLDVLDKPAVNPADEKLLFKIIKASFSQRRKTLANSLSNMTGYDKKFIEQCLTQMGKNVNIRGEQLSLQDYCMLSNKILQNIQKSCFNS